MFYGFGYRQIIKNFYGQNWLVLICTKFTLNSFEKRIQRIFSNTKMQTLILLLGDRNRLIPNAVYNPMCPVFVIMPFRDLRHIPVNYLLDRSNGRLNLELNRNFFPHLRFLPGSKLPPFQDIFQEFFEKKRFRAVIYESSEIWYNMDCYLFRSYIAGILFCSL